MASLHEIFSHTTDAVFATDATHRIVYQNEAFDRICPHARGHTPGRRCYEVLCGQTLDGKRSCNPNCPVAGAVQEHKEVNDFDLFVPQPNGEVMLVNVGACAVSRELLPVSGLFILRPINVRRFAERVANNVNGYSQPVPEMERLTKRERTVLRLLSEGYGTRELAGELQVSPVTVRNHIRNLLQKLSVHSRAEAVSYAYRKHLV